MKKIYLCAIALSVGSISFGQLSTFDTPTRAMLTHQNDDVNTIKNINNGDKTPGQVIWSENFTGGMPTGYTTGGPNGSSWVINQNPINNQGTGGFTNTGPIASSSAGNHMLFFAGNEGGFTDRDSWFQTTSIDLVGALSHTVRFEQKFRLCCASAAALNIVVSADSTFATGAYTYDARRGVAINSMSADPLVTSINISDNFGGYTGKIWIRFHWNLGASHYFWMIDDISVIESYDNDMITFQNYYGVDNVPYTRIPATQVAPVDFSVQTTNVGAADQNATLTADINGGLFTATSAVTTIPALVFGATVSGSTDSLFTTASFTPPTTFAVPYTVTLTVNTDSTDVSPSDNTVTFNPFEVTSGEYAQDDNVAATSGGGGTHSTHGDEFEAGNYYDMYTNTNALSIDVWVHTDSDVGGAIEVKLYDLTSGSFVLVDVSNPVVIAAGDLGAWMSIPLPNTPALTAGSYYFACVHAYGGGSEFYYGTSGTSPANTPTSKGGPTSLIYYPTMSAPATGANFYTSRTPMVRLHISPFVGVDAVETSNVNFNVFPNPSNTGEFNINLISNETNYVALTVKNVVGQTIINETVSVVGNTTHTISLTDYSKGVYFLTIGKETVKLIVD
ncbi:MAG: hypothetical protein COB15_11960 [Flavobacteriales bacterium]|nr:MAG: hypothetical protein COB15_11960 [Flavobacteriales bacterium]